jgi:hypothetical protein
MTILHISYFPLNWHKLSLDYALGMEKNEIEIGKKLQDDNINEWFLFLSNEIDLADQIESYKN